MIGKMLDERAAVISAELEEAKRLRAEAAALLADYQKRAAGAEAEAQSHRGRCQGRSRPFRRRIPRRAQDPDRAPRKPPPGRRSPRPKPPR